MCPDFDYSKEGPGISGDPATMISNKVIFQIKMCDEDMREPGDPPCETDKQKIKEFINDI